MRHFSHLNTAKQILSSYNGGQPFGHFIREFFKANKKYGSKDRKSISQLCYGYFRLGKSCENLEMEDRILLGLFLTTNQEHELLKAMRPVWSQEITRSVSEKIEISEAHLNPTGIFPFIENCSESIIREKFALSHLQQPDLFVRVRPGKKKYILNKLAERSIEFREIEDNTVCLPNASKLDEIININRDAVVQDYNSQRTGEFIQQALKEIKDNKQTAKVWDCCAASGGKSIMAVDIDPTIQLTVSDIRENILFNLRKRLQEAEIKNYRHAVVDLSVQGSAIKAFANEKFDLIIADVPCTGSGTWGRTPEHLLFFSAEQIELYSNRQKKIINNIVSQINHGGFLLYITCSVYTQENEQIARHIEDKLLLKPIRKQVLEGYEIKADTMFAALFQKVNGE